MLKGLRSNISFDEEELQEQWEADRVTGHALFKMYEWLYTETKITAAEFCIMNYYNDQLGSPGGDFKKWIETWQTISGCSLAAQVSRR